MILHCLHISKNCSASDTIIIRSPDTDVFILLMKYAEDIKKVLVMDTGVGDKRRLINVSSAAKAIGPELSNALPSLHAYTGCDSTSSFVRKGKVVPLRLLQQHPQYIPAFTSFGTSSTMRKQHIEDIEAFTCKMYEGKSGIRDIDKLRYVTFLTRYSPGKKLLTNDRGIDLSLLPPCRSSLMMHIARVNYQCLIWKQAHIQNPELPKPHDGHGWCLHGNDLEYKWTTKDILPQDLADLVLEDHDGEDDSELDMVEYNISEDVIVEEDEEGEED